MKTKTLIIALTLSVVALCSCGQQPAEEAETQAQETPAQTEQVDDYSTYNIVSFEWEDKGTDSYIGLRTFDIKMINNGDFAVTLVSPVVCFVDEDGNTLGTTYPQLQGNLQPGTYATEEAFAMEDDFDILKISDVVIDNYQYYTIGLDEDLYVEVNTIAEKADVYEVDS